MIYTIIITSVTYPEPLFEWTPGRSSRKPDPYMTSVLIQAAGDGKLKYMQVGNLKASIYQEGDYFAIVVHDGDDSGADNIGRMLKLYFKKLLEENRLPEEEEVKRYIAYGLLPSVEELGEIISAITPEDVEPFVQSREVRERVSLFTALSSAFKRALRPMSRDKVLKAFYNGDLRKTIENAFGHIKEEIPRIVFIKAALLGYLSSPKIPIVDPNFVAKEIEKISNDTVRGYFKIFLDYATGTVTYGDICEYVNSHRKEIEELLEGDNKEIYAAIFAYPSAAEWLYKKGYNILKDISPYFSTLYEALLHLGAEIEAGEKKDKEALIELREKTRKLLKEAITHNLRNLIGFRLYSYVYSDYIFFASVSSEYDESLKSMRRVASLIPSALVPLLSDLEAPTLAFTWAFPAIVSLRSFTIAALYYSIADIKTYKEMRSSYKEPLRSLIRLSRSRIAAGRIGVDTMIHLLSEMASTLSFLSELSPEFDECIKRIVKTLREIVHMEYFEGLYKNAEHNPVARYNRAEISANFAILVAQSFGRLYSNVKVFEKAMNILERLVIFTSLAPDHIDRLTGVYPLLALIKFVYKSPTIAKKEVYTMKFNSVKELVKQIDAPPVAKFLLFYELYKLAKSQGSMSEVLLDIYNSRASYVESAGGDKSLLEKIE